MTTVGAALRAEVWIAVAALLGACAGGEQAPPPPTSGETGSSATPDEVSALESQGFTVAEGALVISDMSGCCDPGAFCWGDNPSTPYGTPVVPPAPGEAEAVDLFAAWGPLPEDTRRVFRLRPDEAVVLLGRLPPRARYFSYRTYVASRAGVDHPIVGSLGASLNHQVLAADRGDARIWGEPFAVVTSMDASIERRVRAALQEAGWSAAALHADRITGSVVRPGWGSEADTFFGIVRVAVWDDPVAGEAWLAAPDVRVLRVTPEAEEAWPEPWPWPSLPPRGTGVTEPADLATAVTRLADAVAAAHPDRAALVTAAIPVWAETVQCVADELECGGDIRDRWGARTVPFVLGEDEAVVVVGVNHERAGKAVYSNATVQTVGSQRSIATLESPAMPGSARGWLPDEPRADDLYAWVVARDCSRWPAPCAEVPYTCPGVDEAEPLAVIVRAYLEPATGAAPLSDELVPDLAIKLFAPGSQPP